MATNHQSRIPNPFGPQPGLSNTHASFETKSGRVVVGKLRKHTQAYAEQIASRDRRFNRRSTSAPQVVLPWVERPTSPRPMPEPTREPKLPVRGREPTLLENRIAAMRAELRAREELDERLRIAARKKQLKERFTISKRGLVCKKCGCTYLTLSTQSVVRAEGHSCN